MAGHVLVLLLGLVGSATSSAQPTGVLAAQPTGDDLAAPPAPPRVYRPKAILELPTQ